MGSAAAFASLTDAEFQALDHFLLYEVDSDESMQIELLDGFLHAIAIGPTTIIRITGRACRCPLIPSSRDSNPSWTQGARILADEFCG